MKILESSITSLATLPRPIMNRVLIDPLPKDEQSNGGIFIP